MHLQKCLTFGVHITSGRIFFYRGLQTEEGDEGDEHGEIGDARAEHIGETVGGV